VGASGPYADASDSSIVGTYARQFLDQLDQVMPGVSAHWNGRATLSTPWSDPNSLGSSTCYRVGQVAAFGGYEKARQGRCHFAGEHCSFDFQGYMEGAAREGQRAAGEILADLRAGQTS
jgi:monoamine oxidase